jgi:hypothetical protein
VIARSSGRVAIVAAVLADLGTVAQRTAIRSTAPGGVPRLASMDWIRRNLKFLIPGGVVVVAVAAYLAFGVFGVHTLFIDDTVDEAGPVFASGASADGVDTGSTGSTVPSSEPPEPPPVSSDATAEPDDIRQDVGAAETPVAVAGGEPDGGVTTEIVTLYRGTFGPRSHPGEGVASVLTDGSAQRFLRFEQFATDNGPDLNVYLTTADADADEGDFDDDGEYVDLGNLKGNIGDQNYEIPPDVDLARFDTVVVWCVRFGVAFTTADLVPTK